MIGMGKLSYRYKIPGRSIPSVHSRYEDALTHHQRARKVLYNRSKISGEAFVNAVMLHFLDMTPSDQERILVEYIPRFEQLVQAEPDSPLDVEADVDTDSGAAAQTPTKGIPGKAAQPPRRRKGAG